MILIPNTDKKFLQNNQTNVLGNIWSSFNLDLSSNIGRLKISPRMMISSQGSIVTTLTTTPCVFRHYNSRFWTISGTQVHDTGSDLLGASWSASAGSPTTCDVAYSDMELFNNKLYFTVKASTNNFYSINGTTISSALGSIGSNGSAYPTMLLAYGSLLYASQTNIVYSITTGDAVSTVLTIGNSADATQIVWMRASSNRIWIGTINKINGKGFVYEWDGVSTQTTRFYRLESQGALACVIKDDIPWIMDTNGRLLVFNSSSFKEMARLPNLNILTQATAQTNIRFIHPNGMSLIESRINMLINNLNSDSSGTINENLPSGIWEFDDNVGLYHKQSLSLQDDDSAASAITDYGQNRLSIVGALSDMKNFESPAQASANGTFLAGALFYPNASITEAAVFINDSNDTIQKSGYFVTTWIDSQNIQDVWQSIIATYKQLLNSTDKIILKYRTTEATPTEISITWVTTSQFTTTTNVLGKEGYEVEVIQGTGSGKTSHITTIDVTGATYTVNLDDTFTGVTTGTAKARLQAWTKITPEITGQTFEWAMLNIGSGKPPKSPRIQLKCCLLYTGKNELHRLAIINKPHQLLD